ncbi:MAG: ParB/RepB/Spo0J family partition protein [Burkholderiaceae bacterium]|nr:MAG: ParB/RepB/Spo0J family partition protein [Burkholderiaceae bacterium]
MRLLPWGRSKVDQLELLDADPAQPCELGYGTKQAPARQAAPMRSPKRSIEDEAGAGRALLVPLDRLIEDPNNPRTEFPEAEIDELADSMREHGILQPLVVSPANATGRHRILHGAKRSRAARLAGLSQVPVVVSDAPPDPYAQAAENQKRHGLTPMDLARLIRRQADAGDSNATIAKLLGIDQTTIAHHLALLDLPRELSDAMQSGRCTSPRTLFELKKLHEEQPEQVKALLDGAHQITRGAVNAVRSRVTAPRRELRQAEPQAARLARAEAACARLEAALDQVASADPRVADTDLQALKQRIANLGSRLP